MFLLPSTGVDDGYASAGDGYASASEGGYWSAAESMSSMRSGNSGFSGGYAAAAARRQRPASASSDSDDEVTATSILNPQTTVESVSLAFTPSAARWRPPASASR